MWWLVVVDWCKIVECVIVTWYDVVDCVCTRLMAYMTNCTVSFEY
jgi:hypothetical protein